MPLLHRRRESGGKASGFRGAGRTKKRGFATRCAGVTYLPGETRRRRRRRAASRPGGRRRPARRRRAREPSGQTRPRVRSGPPARERRAKRWRKKMEASLLQNPPFLCPVALRRRVGFARLVRGALCSNENPEAHRVGPRRQVLCSPSVPRSRAAATLGEHPALRSRADGLPRRAVTPGPCVGPASETDVAWRAPSAEREWIGACVFGR